MTPDATHPIPKRPHQGLPGGRRVVQAVLGLALLLGLGLALHAQPPATVPAPAPAPAPADRIAFDAAVRTLETGFAEKAANDLAEFTKANPTSPLIPEATLLEARARTQIGQLAPAAEILRTRWESLGPLRDQALHLLGEVELRQNHLPEAAAAFARLLADFPESPLALRASLGQALAEFRAGHFSRTAELLGSTNLPFARVSAKLPADESAIRGALLLAESHLRSGATQQALTALNTVTNQPLSPQSAWEHGWLLTSLQRTNHDPEAALLASARLLVLATNTASRDLLARSHLYRADILRDAGRPGDALASYTNVLADNSPAEWRREAMLGIADLPLTPAQLEPALDQVQRIATGAPSDPGAAAARVALAELRLQQYFGTPAAPAPLLAEARALLVTVLSNPPPATLGGRAWFNLGWCEVAGGQIAAAAAAFQAAVTNLADSPLGAVATFKLADCRQLLGDHAAALAHYLNYLERHARTPGLRPGLLERALYQGAVAALDAGDQPTANRLAERAILEFPNGEFRDDTRDLFGQTLSRLYPPERAAEMRQQLATRLVDSPALPEIRLAVARSYLRAGNWTNALAQLDDWTRSYPTHPVMPRAEFERAWAAFKAGELPRAFSLFTNYLARFPNDPSAQQAQMWVGDHLLQKGEFEAAEAGYQLVYQRTNWPVSRLTHEARLLAGRAAFQRQGYRDAKQYFRWLIEHGPPAVTNSTIPPELVAQAYFAYGDCFLEEPESDDRLTDSMAAFARIIDQFPQSREALLAQGKLAACHLQRAELDPASAAASYATAAELYARVLASSQADVQARSQAELGLGLVTEKQAARAAEPERGPLQQRALSQYLNVFHGRNLHPGETASPFWVRRAGLEAARLAESLGLRDQAASLFDSLGALFPASTNAFRQRAAHLRTR
ncbi:MAG: tetratricopeptide repeat protein [Verrucomicrobiales bacterium]|nr:tetratricopeptide repeat protein [Verrucomicrobiales bacterium]